MSWLTALVGFGRSEENAEAWNVLAVLRAEEVLAVCNLGLEDYLVCEVHERAALITARKRLQAAAAAQTGRACRSELAEAAVLFELDGGAKLNSVVANQAFDEVEEALRGRTGE